MSVDGDAVGLCAALPQRNLLSLSFSLGDFAPFHALDQTGQSETEYRHKGVVLSKMTSPYAFGKWM